MTDNSRDPHSILLEIDYVKLLLEDLGNLNELIGKMVEPLISIQTDLLLLFGNNPDAKGMVADSVSKHASDAIDTLAEIAQSGQNILDLVKGRGKIIDVEVHGEDETD